MGIIHTAKRNVKDELIRKLREETLEERKRSNINASLNFRDDAQVDLDVIYHPKNHIVHVWIYLYLKKANDN